MKSEFRSQFHDKFWSYLHEITPVFVLCMNTIHLNIRKIHWWEHIMERRSNTQLSWWKSWSFGDYNGGMKNISEETADNFNNLLFHKILKSISNTNQILRVGLVKRLCRLDLKHGINTFHRWLLLLLMSTGYHFECWYCYHIWSSRYSVQGMQTQHTCTQLAHPTYHKWEQRWILVELKRNNKSPCTRWQ